MATGVDFLESSAIWVWVILNQHEEFAQRKEIRQHVLKIIADAGEDRWVYVHFRTKEEQDELDQGKYDEDEEQDELEQEKYDVCKES